VISTGFFYTVAFIKLSSANGFIKLFIPFSVELYYPVIIIINAPGVFTFFEGDI